MSAPARPVFHIRAETATHGFFAQVVYVLNQLLYCEREGFEPFVYIPPRFKDGANPYYDEARGENSWEYFFEPVSDHDWRDQIGGSNTVRRLSDEELVHLHVNNPQSIFLYPYHHYRRKVRYDRDWYEAQRTKARGVFERYIKIKPEILKAVDRFVLNEFAPGPVLGIHARGTDKRRVGNHSLLARIVPPKKYRRLIDRYLWDHPSARLFIATDQQQFLDEFDAYYPRLVIRTDSLRSTRVGDDSNVFQQPGNGYQKGLDVLRDALLLSRCDHLFKCCSAVGEFALYFNRDLTETDVSHYYAREPWISLLTPLDWVVERRERGNEQALRAYYRVMGQMGRWKNYLLRPQSGA